MKKYLLDTNSIIYAINNSFVFPQHYYYFSIIAEIELLSLLKQDTILVTSDKQLLNSDLVKTIELKDLKNENKQYV